MSHHARQPARREFVAGPAGRIECAVDAAQGEVRGVALVAHPHPLFGGSLDNKVAQTLARSLAELGYAAWRPNFRGVGASEGSHDEGRGEVADLAAVLAHASTVSSPSDSVVLAGFSFGAAMQTLLAQQLIKEGRAATRLVLIGLAVTHYTLPNVPADTILIHGERDETVPLAAVLDWARPQELPVIVLPGADHFFHGRLNLLRTIVRQNWRA
jgi:alpha/beta superfamily hydrolase